MKRIKLSWIVMLLFICMIFSMLCLSYVKNRESEIYRKRSEAIAHNQRELPVYYEGRR